MAKAKAKIKVLRKGQRCKEGWTPVKIKIGKVTQRACVRGKVTKNKGSWSGVILRSIAGVITAPFGG